MKKAIVFGASGLIGSQLVELLIEDPDYDKIILFNRRSLSYNSPKIDEHIINFDEIDQFSDKIAGEAVFCTLGTTIKKARSIENFIKVDYDIPLKVAEIAKKNGINRYLLVSSIGANASSKNYYTKTKGRIEQELKNLYFEHLKILRPSLLVGPRKEFRLLELFSKILMGIFGIFLFWKLSKYKAIKSIDVAKAMIILSKRSLKKTIYESDEIKKLLKQ